MMGFIRSLAPFADLESKQSHAEDMPFKRMKVRLKKEIVTMGVPRHRSRADRRHLCGARRTGTR